MPIPLVERAKALVKYRAANAAILAQLNLGTAEHTNRTAVEKYLAGLPTDLTSATDGDPRFNAVEDCLVAAEQARADGRLWRYPS